MVKILSTLDEVKAAFAKHCIGPQTTEAAAAAASATRFAKLSSEAIKVLNDHTLHHAEEYVVDLNGEGILEYLFGVEPAGDRSPLFTVGKDGYIATRNVHNRKLSMSRVGPVTKHDTYANLKARGRWIFTKADPLTFDWNGQIQTAQHRLTADFLVRATGVALGYVSIYLGVPPQWRDLADKARARKSTDDDRTDADVCSLEVIPMSQQTYGSEPDHGSDLVKLRDTLIASRKKLTGNLGARMSGSDIPPTGDKLTEDERLDIVDRLGGEDIVTDFLVRVYESGRSQTGKLDRPWVSLFSRDVVATALILASNDDARIDSMVLPRQESETAEQFTERRLAEREAMIASGDIVIDDELCKSFLEALATSTAEFGPFATQFAELFQKVEKDKKSTDKAKYLWKPSSWASMSAMVELIRQFRTGETGSVWTVYREGKDGNVSPYYRCFGGIDIGYTKRTKAKAE